MLVFMLKFCIAVSAHSKIATIYKAFYITGISYPENPLFFSPFDFCFSSWPLGSVSCCIVVCHTVNYISGAAH